jgi:predicted methyltransferase
MQHFFRAGLLGLVIGSLMGGTPAAADLQAALADSSRPEADRARDAGRKPAQVLAFFDIGPGDKVADLLPGSGYYSRILVSAVGEEGTVYAGNNPFYLDFFKDKWNAVFQEPSFQKVQRIDGPLDNVALPQDGSLDAVIMALAYHDLFLIEEDRTKMNARILAALKPGGVYGIIDHHAKEGTGTEAVKSLHRIEEAVIVKEITDAGFTLAKKGDFLRNAEDDRTKIVFDPALRGKTDRFVLRFEKPKQ